MMLFLVLFLLVKAISGGIITSLPGYTGNLQFYLETGYVGVQNDSIQLFHYFVESQYNPPETAPLMVYVCGGPGYSGLWGFFFGMGPLNVDFNHDRNDNTTIPTLYDNEYAWTKFMNVLFIDGPAGTGFSYAKAEDDYYTDNFNYAPNINEFVRKWLEKHTKYSKNDLYISGDGFSGNSVPHIVGDILNANEDGQQPYVNLQGFLLIGPGTNFTADRNAMYVYTNRLGFVPDNLFQVADEACGGNFYNNTSEECVGAMTPIKKLTENINLVYTLDPSCGGGNNNATTTTTNDKKAKMGRRSLQQLLPDRATTASCRKYNVDVVNIWINFEGVADALQVDPEHSPDSPVLRNQTIDKKYYRKDPEDNIPYYKALTAANIRGFIMSGDHDLDAPYFSIMDWIGTLGLEEIEHWRDITVSGETLGYTRTYASTSSSFNFTFASVKGGGHFVPQFLPVESYRLAYNWTMHLEL